ncbi:MAG: TPM domain-containing protein [Lachnospiraceae bacterium]|nr:TPM domain-containing protein [Lachnospiraceae bacterium]
MMKMMKRFSVLILLALLLLFPGRSAAALGAPAPAGNQTVRIIDRANVWSAAAESEFTKTAAELAGKYETDAVLLSVYVLQDSSLGDQVYDSINVFAKAFYEANGFGRGDDRTGMIFVFCKESGNRQYAFYAAGREAESYNEEDASFVTETLQPYLEGGDYDEAARRYLELVQTHEEQGGFDKGQTAAESSNYLWTFGLALLVAWAITSSMKRRMRPVQKATAARTYTVRNSYELRRYNEIYLGTTVTRMPRNQNRQQPGR